VDWNNAKCHIQRKKIFSKCSTFVRFKEWKDFCYILKSVSSPSLHLITNKVTSASFPFAVRSLRARARARGSIYLRIITFWLQKRAAGYDRSIDQSDLHVSCIHDSEPRIRRYACFENDPVGITIVTTYVSSRMFSLYSCVATPSAICASHHCTYTTVHHFLNKNSFVKDDGPHESVDNRRHKGWLQSFAFQTFSSINNNCSWFVSQ